MKLTVMGLIRDTFERHVRRVRKEEEGVALISAVLFMILLAGMSLALLTIILGQIGPAYAAQKGTKTVYAAQAGLQAALGVVRTASGTSLNPSGVAYGSINKLPCTFSGKLDGATTDVSYTVTLSYFVDDPTGKADTWLAANKLACSASGVTVQPNYAYMVSQGIGAASPNRPADEGNRAVAAVYKFQVTNVNVPGGRIYDFNRTMCLNAENLLGSVKVGSQISFKAAALCVADEGDKDARQLWVYDDDYQIKLASSLLDGATPLCITGVPTARATLQKCQGRFDQLWSWDGSHSWIGEKSDLSDYSSARFRNVDDYLQIDTSISTFAPDAAVGPAAAGYSTHQIVNYKEFGRCTDVTDTDPDKAFMISYPCKQDPSASKTKLAWNHEWYYTEPTTPATSVANQQIYVLVDKKTSGKKCLQAPTTNKYVTLTTCSATDIAQKWTRNYKTGDAAGSYVFINQNRCLTADGADKYNGNWSRLTMAPCTGADNQKWNAPFTANDSTFGSFKEIGG